MFHSPPLAFTVPTPWNVKEFPCVSSIPGAAPLALQESPPLKSNVGPGWPAAGLSKKNLTSPEIEIPAPGLSVSPADETPLTTISVLIK